MNRGPYIRRVSRTGWWLTQRRYFGYMMREMSSAFIGGYTILLAVGLYRLSQSDEAYEAFVAHLMAPAGRAFAGLTFAFAVYHTYTWFKVTPKAMPLVVAGRRVPGFVIVMAHWAVFVAVCAAAWFIAGG